MKTQSTDVEVAKMVEMSVDKNFDLIASEQENSQFENFPANPTRQGN